MAEYLDHLDQLELVERLINRDRILQDRSNPFEKYDDAGFIFRFRFPKHMVLDILELVKERLQPIQVKVSTIQPVIQVLLSLQFYGIGTLLTCLEFTPVQSVEYCHIVKFVVEH